ncbi:MAG: hypothetical protein NVS4B1_15630 [Ktedonobacteraceae bacterium]
MVAESSLPQEDVVVQRWWSLSPGTHLPLTDGGICQLVFVGRSGGSLGPDVRDAVLQFPQGEQRVGDIEFHVRASDWVAHKHATDPRYNNVMLHVVLLCDDPHPTTRQDGYHIPVCSLYDLPIIFTPASNSVVDAIWPCHTVMRNLSVTEQEKLLQRAGLLRFEQKTHAFVEALHKMENVAYVGDLKMETNRCLQAVRLAPVMPPTTSVDEFVGCNVPCGGSSSLLSDLYNDCLIPALAEGLAYGRDRAFFRAAGQRLLGQVTHVPEPLGRAIAPSPLDAKRLNVLHNMLARERNVWDSLHNMLVQAQDTMLPALRKYFCTIGVSLARSDILICNVVLPFAAAIALLEHNTTLGERAQQLYELHPGLSSNTITRMMCTQLLLAHEPRGSCQQQGLHYIYQQTCQAKQCAECMMGRNIL